MDRDYYIRLGKSGLRMPIAADLVLHESADPQAVRRDGRRLGEVVERTARRYKTPLAFPLMDLTLEKAEVLSLAGIEEEQWKRWQFQSPIAPGDLFRMRMGGGELPSRSVARLGAIRYIAGETDLVPVGLSIGPFSLMTGLMQDPITAVAMAGRGVTADEDHSVRLATDCLALAESAVLGSVQRQIGAGAKAVIICEPAANRMYISPRQLAGGARTFEQFVIQPNAKVRQLLRGHGADLIFHNCGELTDDMVRAFAERLDPVILSLGSSRKLWDDAALVPENVVLLGNVPSKSFYSDAAMPDQRVAELTRELREHMAATCHPFILGSECDVLYVAESAPSIVRKVEIMMSA